MILFALGIIIGLLLNPSKSKLVEIVPELAEKYLPHQKAQFLESKSGKEKFEEANGIGDLL